MDRITAGKVLVGSTIKHLNKAKLSGDLCMLNLYLLMVINELQNTCELHNSYAISTCLAKKARAIQNKYPEICTYKEKRYDKVTVTGYKKPELNTVLNINTPPIVVDYDCYTYEFEELSFSSALFESVFTDNDSIGLLKIISLPSVGTLTYDGEDVIVNQIISIVNINKLKYNYGALISAGEDVTFTFQLADNTVNPVFSNTATFNICVPEQINQPPTISLLSLDIEDNGEYIFTTEDLTTGLSYSDPEGDLPLNLKIITLPANGVLYYNGVPVVVDNVITYVDIENGLFKFTPDDLDVSYTISFQVKVSDQGSGEYSL